MSKIDEELNALLGIDSDADNASGASADKVATDNDSDASGDDAKNKDDATTKKISERGDARFKELTDEINRLKSEQNKSSEMDLDTLLSKVQDKPTQELLSAFGKSLIAKVEEKYKPVVSNVQESKFENEFANWQSKFPNLKSHKDELRKEFARNPNSNLKEKIGSLLLDLADSKIKPLDGNNSRAPRDNANIDLDKLTSSQLYDLMEANRPRR